MLTRSTVRIGAPAPARVGVRVITRHTTLTTCSTGRCMPALTGGVAVRIATATATRADDVICVSGEVRRTTTAARAIADAATIHTNTAIVEPTTAAAAGVRTTSSTTTRDVDDIAIPGSNSYACDMYVGACTTAFSVIARATSRTRPRASASAPTVNRYGSNACRSSPCLRGTNNDRSRSERYPCRRDDDC